MALLYERNLQGPKTHAFVIGVGSYPDAKPNRGVNPSLQRVPDLPSAADNAKLVTDWLIENADRLGAPLATLDVLISDPNDLNNRYSWNRGRSDPATYANVKGRGDDWFTRATKDKGDVAFFYCCGHGASHLEQPVVFLEDLNKSRLDIWSHINLGLLASTFRRDTNTAAVFLFSDSCGEFVTEFELGKAQDCRFFPDPQLFAAARSHVSLLCAAPEGRLAYEGEDKPQGRQKFGRFTQAILKALNGSSARLLQNKWSVTCRDLLADLKSIRRVFFGHWTDEPFEPHSAVTPVDPVPIVFPSNFELPVVVMTDPSENMPAYSLLISDRNDPTPPWLRQCPNGRATAWLTTVPPSRNALYAVAVNGQVHYSQIFLPKEPIFDPLLVSVQ